MWDWISKLQELKQLRQVFALVTITGVQGSSPREVGAKMIVVASGQIFGTIGGGQLEMQVTSEAAVALHRRQSKTVRYSLCARTGQCCGGEVEVFIEVIGLGPHLYIFGGGHVGLALAKTMVGTPFSVTVIDEREDYRADSYLPAEVSGQGAEGVVSFMSEMQWEAKNCYVVVMTHSHSLDEEIIATMLTKPLRYLGLIGSKLKWAKFQQNLQRQGLDSTQLDRVHCPIGLDIGGGKAPKEIAISVAAELLKIHYQNV